MKSSGPSKTVWLGRFNVVRNRLCMIDAYDKTASVMNAVGGVRNGPWDAYIIEGHTSVGRRPHVLQVQAANPAIDVIQVCDQVRWEWGGDVDTRSGYVAILDPTQSLMARIVDGEIPVEHSSSKLGGLVQNCGAMCSTGLGDGSYPSRFFKLDDQIAGIKIAFWEDGKRTGLSLDQIEENDEDAALEDSV